MNGKIAEKHLIQHSRESEHQKILVSCKLIVTSSSYLRSLVPEFNAVAMEYLVHSVKRSATEGKAIDMKQAFSLASLHTITRVCDMKYEKKCINAMFMIM